MYIYIYIFFFSCFYQSHIQRSKQFSNRI